VSQLDELTLEARIATPAVELGEPVDRDECAALGNC
jgi:hypothetical protein